MLWVLYHHKNLKVIFKAVTRTSEVPGAEVTPVRNPRVRMSCRGTGPSSRSMCGPGKVTRPLWSSPIGWAAAAPALRGNSSGNNVWEVFKEAPSTHRVLAHGASPDPPAGWPVHPAKCCDSGYGTSTSFVLESREVGTLSLLSLSVQEGGAAHAASTSASCPVSSVSSS